MNHSPTSVTCECEGTGFAHEWCTAVGPAGSGSIAAHQAGTEPDGPLGPPPPAMAAALDPLQLDEVLLSDELTTAPSSSATVAPLATPSAAAAAGMPNQWLSAPFAGPAPRC